MRRALFAAAVLFLGGPLVAADPPKPGSKEPAKEPPKDTPAAAFTRTKKLKGKVTLDYKNEFLNDVLKELSGQLEDQKLGSISFNFAQGVSKNTRVTYAGKDVTAEEALDGILKQIDLGYIVVSKEKDRYDGWLEVVKGPNRGYPDGVGPKPGEMAKPDDMKKPDDKKPDDPKKPDEAKKPDEPKPGDTPTEEDEKLAAGKVDLAKMLQEEGKTDRAKTLYKFVVMKYPGTKAAKEAKELLEKLEK